ncbi:MAG: M16 family metallopeptidase [Oscillospiraceae bacterium]
MVINASVLDNRYALNGENLEAEMCGLIRDCILSPNAENGAFDETVTSLMKGEVIDAIDSVINNKSSYAAQNANKTAYRGETMEKIALGTHEEAEKVTPQSAYAAYRRIIETSRVEIFAAGCSDFEDAKRIFGEMFNNIPRHDICGLSTSVSPLKPEPEYVSDMMNMSQAIVRMYFKAPECEDREARLLLTMILGGMTTSRFFMNIREKQSLCYYCSCSPNNYKRVITAYAGVEPDNIKRCEEAILAELKDIAENGVTEDELHTAKLEYSNQISTIYDSTGAMMSWYLNQLAEKNVFSPEEMLKRVEAVTADRVQAAARMYKLDTVYTLSGEEAAE